MRSTRHSILGAAFAATLFASLGLAVTACDSSRNRNQGGGGGGGDGACAAGAHSCSGLTLETCADGAFAFDQVCEQACSEALGCSDCAPGGTGCSGDRVVQCGGDGKPGSQVVEDCAPSTCAMSAGQGICTGPCDPLALARSYTGCVYYAVDLPQETIKTLSPQSAADHQFGIAVSNPWPIAIDVVVERNDAAVGAPAQPRQVVKRQVAAGGVAVLPLPMREVSGYAPGKKNRSLITPNAYRVTTTRPASVYQFNPLNNSGAYSNDASLLIPVNAFDRSYVVLGWPGYGAIFGIDTDKRSFVTIVASRAGTRVRVTPSTDVMKGDNVPAMKKGQSYSFTLGEFEALNLECADPTNLGQTAADFSGTRIEADAPVAVWSGVECSGINPPNASETCCCDHLEEQLFPRSSLGKEYVVVRSEHRGHGAADAEFYRILGLEDGTAVATSLPPPDDQFTLKAGEVREVLLYGEDFTVEASEAVTVGQFQISQSSSSAFTGDPSFMLVPPVTQFRPSYIFSVPQNYSENWMLIAIPAGTPVMLDGVPAEGCNDGPAGRIAGQAYDAVRCPVPEGAHTVSAAKAFGLVVQGWGPGPVSYGYTGGMEFEPVNTDCTIDGDCPVAEFCFGGVCGPPIQ